jgi:hypothetical protein
MDWTGLPRIAHGSTHTDLSDTTEHDIPVHNDDVLFTREIVGTS